MIDTVTATVSPIERLTTAMKAIGEARAAVSGLDSLRNEVARLRKVANDPTASDDEADEAASKLIEKSEKLRLADLGKDRLAANVDRAIVAAATLCRSSILPALDAEARTLATDARAAGNAVLRSLVSPSAASISSDLQLGYNRERAIGNMGYFFTGVFEASNLIGEIENTRGMETVSLPSFTHAMLQSWPEKTATIRAGIARLQSMAK